ncbi:major capsid protein [Paraburkholderia kururiensis]|uniref:major capsid protein n=1 Tax=Paraburkholderia kururiensis TaxID=984307 RepID=UPI00034D1CB4|nr:hypothetical protein [Paraburkholderia kururiensis]
MAILGGTALTYADWAKRMDDDGKVATIINLLSQTNEILDDMLVVEGNLPTGHKTTVRTGLPSATWRLLNYGVVKTKSTTAQVTDACGMLECYSEIDKDLADLNGNTAEFRLSEDLAFLEGMNQQMAQTMFYGNTAVNPERFMGFAPRFNTVTTSNAQTAANVIDAGGTQSTNTSIWIVVWGPNTAHGIFPKGKISGLQHRDLGEWPLSDANGNLYQGYRTHFKWDMGLTVRDWRYVVRIANIDVTQLSTGSAANLINALIRGVHRLPTAPVTLSSEQKTDAPDGGQMQMGRTVIYCNRVIRTYLDLQAVNKTNVLLRLDEWEGKVITTFRGVPIRTCDQILNTESRVV